MNEYQWAEYELMTTEGMLLEVTLYKEVYDVVWHDVLLEYRLQCLNNVIGRQLIGKTP